jgi:hypothetical protein
MKKKLKYLDVTTVSQFRRFWCFDHIEISGNYFLVYYGNAIAQIQKVAVLKTKIGCSR